ncbi:anti-sigma regulatory factor (Ser/Thr protein kinase) [Streptacidiphilus sp. MAP12-20]|uniref:ATP-binding protein n=1 Tax=Streptacidiphilus sp. MAP12-20 TaxID=3156299 RepID=UPI003518C38E
MNTTDHASLPAPQTWEVQPEAAAVRPARLLVLEVARFWNLPFSDGALRDVELCASELITNAALYTKLPFKVTVGWTGERLRVEVEDTSLVPPGGDGSIGSGNGGRGLALVGALAHSCGWCPQGAGKVVWFETAPDQALDPDRRLAVLVEVAHSRLTQPLAFSA